MFAILLKILAKLMKAQTVWGGEHYEKLRAEKNYDKPMC